MYDFKAFAPDGRTKRGLVEAETAKAARLKLKRQGLMVTEIAEKTSGGKSSGSSTGSLVGGRVTAPDMALLTRQLASLVKANIPLVEALSALVEQTEKEKLKVIINDVRQNVNEGASLAKALKNHPKVFDNVYVNMVEAGESSGTLGLVLLRLADLKEAQMRLRRKVISGMTYPVLMMLVAVVLLVVIFTFVIPQLTKVFDSMNKPVPLTTQALIVISDIITNQWYILLTAAVVGVLFFRRYINSKNGRPHWDRFKLNAPVFGQITRMIAITQFSNTMGTLLGSGVPILTSMLIARNLVGNSLISRAIDNARENITEGQSIAEPLRRSKEFPPLVIHMIAIGERTGELSQMLVNVAEAYEEQINSKIEGLTALLEPLMIIAMGGIVGFIVMAIFIPLLEISSIQ